MREGDDEDEDREAGSSASDRGVALVDNDANDAEDVPEEEERQLPFGELALLKELVSREQLESLLHAQKDRREQERPIKIATLLVREGVITRAEAKEVLRLQRQHGPIEGFHLLQHLGTGGMGCVFRAREEATGRELAVKILPPSATANSRYRARFLREAAALQELDHPNLVRCYAQGEAEEHLYFAMEFVPGMTLRERLKRHGAFAEAELRPLVRQLALAIKHYWDLRFVHRDIKPENILVTPDGIAKLTDLGLCRQLDDDAHLTRVGKTLGTPLYISPELARGRSDIDIRSDLYSLGATIYHLACGVPPFESAAQAELLRAHVEQMPQPLRLKNPRVSEGLEQLVMALLEKDPVDRPASPDVLLAALDRLDAGQPPLPDRPRRRREGSATGSTADRQGADRTERLGSAERERTPARGTPKKRPGSSSAVRNAMVARWAPRKGLTAPIGAAVALVVLFVSGVLLGAHARTLASTPPAQVVDVGSAFVEALERSPEEAARLALDRGRAWHDDVPGQLYRLGAVLERLPDTSTLRIPVEAELALTRRRFEAQAHAALEALRANVIPLLEAGRVDEARTRLASFPAPYRSTSAWTGFEELKSEVDLQRRPPRG